MFYIYFYGQLTFYVVNLTFYMVNLTLFIWSTWQFLYGQLDTFHMVNLNFLYGQVFILYVVNLILFLWSTMSRMHRAQTQTKMAAFDLWTVEEAGRIVALNLA